MRFPLCRLHPTNITHDRRRESAFCSNQGLSAKKSASSTLLLFFLSSRVLSFPSFSRGNRGLLLRADLPPLPPPPPPPPLHNPKNARQKRERKRNKRGEESSLFFFLLTAFLFLFFLSSPLSLFPAPFGCLFLPLLLAPLFPSPSPRIRWSRERRVKAWRKGKKLCQNFTQAFHNLFLEIVTPSVEWFPHDCLPPLAIANRDMKVVPLPNTFMSCTTLKKKHAGSSALWRSVRLWMGVYSCCTIELANY